MERAVTYSDHSTTVTTCYFTQATHKSYGPMTQLLPDPQCPNVTHVPTVLLQTSSPLFTHPFFHPFTPLFPPSFHAQPFNIHPRHLSVYYFSHPCFSVCLSICLLCPSDAPSPLRPMLRWTTHSGAAAGLVHFMSCEDGYLKSPPGISLCHQHLASTLPQITPVRLAQWPPLQK